MSAIGIDFGTTNSVVAHWSAAGVEALDIDPAHGEWSLHGFNRVLPSVYSHDGDGQITFGWAAKLGHRTPYEAVKRLFATQQEIISAEDSAPLAVEEVATMIFAEMKQRAARQGVDASQAVVTVPANSRGLARHRTKVCAGMAGFEVLTLLNEPTAAAMAYAANNPGDQQILVFDWGGGTLDVTVLRSAHGIFMEQASKGLPTRGGMDFDARLARAVRATIDGPIRWDEADRYRFRRAIELAKIELSTQQATSVVLPDGSSRRVTRQMFDDAVRDLVEESRRPLEQCLRDIGAGAGAIDAVVMVGGTSKVPLVRDFVGDVIGIHPVEEVDPMVAVGEGAAIAAAIMTGELDSNDFFVATEHALGTVVVNDRSDGFEFSPIIPRNHKLPAQGSNRYFPQYPDQESVSVRIIEGDPALGVDHEDNLELPDEFDVPIPPATPSNPGRAFDIVYSYDTDGILHVVVNSVPDGDELSRLTVEFGPTRDKRRLVEMASRVQETISTGRRQSTADAPDPAGIDPESARLLERAHVKVIPFLDGDAAELVRAAADELERSTPAERSAARDALQAQLAPYPYLF